MTPSEIQLEAIKFQAQDVLAPALIDAIGYEEIKDRMTGNLIRTLKAEIYAEQVGEQIQKVQVAFPSSWWQMFKHDVLRIPCNLKFHEVGISFKVMVAYPELPLAMKSTGPHVVKIMRTNEWFKENT